MRKYLIRLAIVLGLLLSIQYLISQENNPQEILNQIRLKNRSCRLNSIEAMIPPHCRTQNHLQLNSSAPVFTPAPDIPEPDGAKNTWWETYGPEGGNIIGMVIDPKNKNHYFAITSSYYSGSFWESKNAGNKWIYKGSFSEEIYDLKSHPNDPNILFILYREGILKTTDGGKNWKKNRFQTNGYDCYAYNSHIAVDPKYPDYVYAAGTYYHSEKSQIAIFISNNGGQTFSRKTLGGASDSSGTYSLAINPVYPAIIYLGGYNYSRSAYKFEYKVYKSTNRGSTWQDISGTINSYPYDIAIDPKNHSKILVATPWSIFISSNGGTSWTKNNAYGYAIAIDPTNSDYIYAGYVDGYFRSTNGGISWTYMDSGSPAVISTGLYGTCKVIFPCSKGIYYLSSSGIYLSGNKGASWKPTHKGIIANDIPAMGVAPSNINKIYAEALNSRFFVSNNAGKSWTGLPQFERCAGIEKIWVHPTNANEIYFLCGG
jgi:photosystem II stability/assembly factor-like uncharacterized protein